MHTHLTTPIKWLKIFILKSLTQVKDIGQIYKKKTNPAKLSVNFVINIHFSEPGIILAYNSIKISNLQLIETWLTFATAKQKKNKMYGTKYWE